MPTKREAEEQIAALTIETLLQAGYSITVNDGEDTPVVKSTNANEIFDAMFSVDEEDLVIYDTKNESRPIGEIMFVHGNDGYDVISDMSASLEQVLLPVLELEEKLEEEMTK